MQKTGSNIKTDFPPSGRYKIQRLLGMGGMGDVYEAWDPRLERTVALKYLKPKFCSEPRIRTRFIREARALAKVSHPRIVKIFEVFTEGETAFFVQEYLEGQDLEWVLDEDQTLSPNEMRKVLIELTEALAVLHENELVHRDLKPANLFIHVDKGLLLLDFGLVLDAEKTRLTQENTIVGTLSYMSPEMVSGDEVTASSDVFQVGLITHVLLTGKNLDRPRTCDWGDLISVANMGVKTPNPDSAIPDDLRKFIRKCCAKKPQDRFKDGQAMYAYLTEEEEPKPPSPPKKTLRPKAPTLKRESKKIDESVGTAPVSSSRARPAANKSLKSTLALFTIIILGLLVFFSQDSSPCSISDVKISPTPNGAVVTFVSGRPIVSSVEVSKKRTEEWLQFSSASKAIVTSHEIIISSLKEGQDYRLRVLLPNGDKSLPQNFTTVMLKLLDFRVQAENGTIARWQVNHGTASHLSLGKDDLLPAIKKGNSWQVELPRRALTVDDVSVIVSLQGGGSRSFSIKNWLNSRLDELFEREPLGSFRLHKATKIFGRGLEDDVEATIAKSKHKKARIKYLREKFSKFVADQKIVSSYQSLKSYFPLLYETKIAGLHRQKQVYSRLIEIVRLLTYADDFRFLGKVTIGQWPKLGQFSLEKEPNRGAWKRSPILLPNERIIRLGSMLAGGQFSSWQRNFDLKSLYSDNQFAIELSTLAFRDRILRMTINNQSSFYIFYEPMLPWQKKQPIQFRQLLPKECLIKGRNTISLSVEGPFAGRRDTAMVTLKSLSLAYRNH